MIATPERRYFWRAGLKAQYVLNPRCASRSIRTWMRPVTQRRMRFRVPAVSVMRAPVDRALSAMACATYYKLASERTVAEYLQRLRTGDWVDMHLVPQAWWLEGLSAADLIPMCDAVGWEREVCGRIGIQTRSTPRIGRLEAPRATNSQRAELESIYDSDVALWMEVLDRA